MEEHYKFTIETWADLFNAARIVPNEYHSYERKFLRPFNLVVHDCDVFIEDVKEEDVDEAKKDDKRSD